MITEDYVSFETAKLLKEKGFDEPCIYVYRYDGSEDIWDADKEDIACQKPTLQMALKWLREKNLFVEIYIPSDIDHEDTIYHDTWSFDIFNLKTKGYMYCTYGEVEYNSYEEACEAAIKYCLENFDLVATNKDIIYFSVNNWFSGENYPPTENFEKWLSDDFNQSFRNDEWCKENKLCVYYGTIDMSTNYTVSAPREWVEKNCPELLTDDEYTYIICRSKAKKKLFGGYKVVWENIEYKKKYSDFVYSQEEVDEGECDRVGDMPFREYREENFGSKYYETGWWEDDEEHTDDEEEEE